jgi:outer membrane immunogenic protein
LGDGNPEPVRLEEAVTFCLWLWNSVQSRFQVQNGKNGSEIVKKKVLLTMVGLVALGTAPALAADLPARTYTKAPALVAAAYDWSGFYAGINGGGASSPASA